MQQVVLRHTCDAAYTWDGVVYTSSGSYANTYTNAAGCDSVHTLNLTINSSDATSSSETACDSYTWDTSSGSYAIHIRICDTIKFNYQ